MKFTSTRTGEALPMRDDPSPAELADEVADLRRSVAELRSDFLDFATMLTNVRSHHGHPTDHSDRVLAPALFHSGDVAEPARAARRTWSV
jgi:hypothetical protein